MLMLTMMMIVMTTWNFTYGKEEKGHDMAGLAAANYKCQTHERPRRRSKGFKEIYLVRSTERVNKIIRRMVFSYQPPFSFHSFILALFNDHF